MVQTLAQRPRHRSPGLIPRHMLLLQFAGRLAIRGAQMPRRRRQVSERSRSMMVSIEVWKKKSYSRSDELMDCGRASRLAAEDSSRQLSSGR